MAYHLSVNCTGALEEIEKALRMEDLSLSDDTWLVPPPPTINSSSSISTGKNKLQQPAYSRILKPPIDAPLTDLTSTATEFVPNSYLKNNSDSNNSIGDNGNSLSGSDLNKRVPNSMKNTSQTPELDGGTDDWFAESRGCECCLGYKYSCQCCSFDYEGGGYNVCSYCSLQENNDNYSSNSNGSYYAQNAHINSYNSSSTQAPGLSSQAAAFVPGSYSTFNSTANDGQDVNSVFKSGYASVDRG